MSRESDGTLPARLVHEGDGESVFESARRRVDPELLAAIDAFLDGDDDALPAHAQRSD